MRHSLAATTRALAIKRVKARLIGHSFPRLQMALIVALTGGFGLLSSYTMLNMGVGSMALRYPLALLCAYLFFLFLIWLWLRTNAEDYVDLPDISGLVPSPRPSLATRGVDFQSGGGGDYAGGGATGSFDVSGSATDDTVLSPLKSVGNAVGTVTDADEVVIPLVAIVLALGIALASLYVVYIAPALFAEVMVDGALSYALFRRLRGQNPQHWLSTTFRHTAIPFAATTVFLATVGWAMAAYAPGAQSLGQVMDHASREKALNN